LVKSNFAKLLFSVTVLFPIKTNREKIMSVQDKINQANAKFGAEFANQDAASLISNYTDDAQLMAPHMPTFTGKDAIESAFQGMFDAGIDGLKLTTVELTSNANEATEVGEFVMSAGGTVLDRGRYIVIWHCIGGNWLIHRDIINSSEPMVQ
tara:strand:+ start:143 stop:598 length:456 start_codon:yes stop_codon:yes gene_type:complete